SMAQLGHRLRHRDDRRARYDISARSQGVSGLSRRGAPLSVGRSNIGPRTSVDESAATDKAALMSVLPVRLVGADQAVPCVDGSERPYLSLDAAASTSALPAVVDRVNEFLPWYSSVHRGAGYKSQVSTADYEDARAAALDFAGRGNRDDVAII